MKIYISFLRCLILMVVLTIIGGCTDTPDYGDDVRGNFDALVEIIDTRYCFLDEKGIDWQATAEKYRSELRDDMSQLELFDVCSRMLDELQDGHVNLSSRFDVSYYRKWWSDYPQDFNLRTLQEYYLKFDYRTVSGMNYKVLEDGIGYIYLPSFASAVSKTSLDYVLAYLEIAKCEVLILDIRNNGGGLLTNVDVLVERFIDKEIPGGFIRHKTGPGHNDFSEPYAISYKPAEEGRIMWHKPVIVLTNRSCYSAANDFVAVLKTLPQVKIAGAKTGGGGGMPFSSELPNGWSIRFSACPINNIWDESVEGGIEPSEGYECHTSAEELASGKDGILDFAIEKARKSLSPVLPTEEGARRAMGLFHKN
ncbi:MAG: S41 family peptidase [Clostridium sp.]|nr:S41 family peptidase [Prevotella sp.]MCM1429494.1 S41 family peptidase [Clostridium sp.]MCM1476110.1 S41 family peptidase [Muribaculaceae bacterium]